LEHIISPILIRKYSELPIIYSVKNCIFKGQLQINFGMEKKVFGNKPNGVQYEYLHKLKYN